MKMSAAANKRPQILELSSPSEILFEGPYDHVVTSYLELYNPSEERVCFKVKTTAPRRYCVRPNSGLIEPGKRTKISIMLQPLDEESLNERSRHKFMVQTTIVGDHLTSLDSVWQEAKPEDIMDSKLRCVFQSDEQKTQNQQSKQQDPTNNVSSSTANILGGYLPSGTTETNSTDLPQVSSKNFEEQPQKLSGDLSFRNKNTSSSEPITSSPLAQPLETHTSNILSSTPTSKPGAGFSANQIQRRSDSSYNAGDKSLASSHNLTASFLQPMSDDYKIVLVSLVMLFIGVILGKYII